MVHRRERRAYPVPHRLALQCRATLAHALDRIAEVIAAPTRHLREWSWLEHRIAGLERLPQIGARFDHGRVRSRYGRIGPRGLLRQGRAWWNGEEQADGQALAQHGQLQRHQDQATVQRAAMSDHTSEGIAQSAAWNPRKGCNR